MTTFNPDKLYDVAASAEAVVQALVEAHGGDQEDFLSVVEMLAENLYDEENADVDE